MERRTVRRVPNKAKQILDPANTRIVSIKQIMELVASRIMYVVEERSSKLILQCGVASIWGGLLWIAAVAYLQFGTSGIIWYPGVSFLHDLLSIISPLLLLVGQFGVYVLHKNDSYWLSNIGLLCSSLGLTII